MGHRSHAVDSSSIEVNRRARRAKTDSLDLDGLLRLLIRYEAGEQEVWSVVRAPSPEAEDARLLHRELMTVKRDRARVINRIKGLLATQGLTIPLTDDFEATVHSAVLWDVRIPGHADHPFRRWCPAIPADAVHLWRRVPES